MEPLKVIADEIVKEYFPQTLEIGVVVKHPDGRTVEIVGGQHMGRHGLSNFWQWREVLPDGHLADKVESGYGWDPAKLK